MTEPETPQPVPDSTLPADELATEPRPEDLEAEAPPEPMTPERVSEWNAYSDIYVVLATLLLTFTVACNYVTESTLWLHLKSGQMITDQMAPSTTDAFSYTSDGRPWYNVNWLFDWAQAGIYKVAFGLVPVNPADETANRGTADQIAIGTLGVVNALARLLTAWLLLKIRHKGPGLWWSAVCVTLALGAIFHPSFGITMGGLGGVASVAPGTWGQVFLAFECLVLFRVFSQGKTAWVWTLIPLFALWANVDISFVTGLLILALAAVGRLLDGSNAAWLVANAEKSATHEDTAESARASERKPISPATALVVTILSFAATLANPYTYHAWIVALDPYIQMFRPAGNIETLDQISFFGPRIREQIGQTWYFLAAFYLVVIALGLATFLVDARRFSWSRFLPYAVLAVIWGVFYRFQNQFAIVFIAAFAVNLQEWYLDKFGTEGRLGWQWSLWSTGGRLVTLGLVFALVGIDITGYRNTLPTIRFGLGYQPDDFPFEAAEFLANHKEIKGNVFNTVTSQADLLIWKAAPDRKVYFDSRAHYFPHELLERWRATKLALSEDNKADWKEDLDKHGVSVLMIEPSVAPITHRLLTQSPNWIPFYDDGSTVMFGRSDASKEDVAFFNANRLDANLLAYRGVHPVGGAERPPNQTTWIDWVFQNRTLSRPRSRTESSRRWLNGLGAVDANGSPEVLPDPAHCILAIQDARKALASSPDDWIAFRRLKDAYRYLMVQESGILAGIAPTSENRDRLRSIAPNNEILVNRFRQRMTALNFAIQTTPPPASDEARRELNGIALELVQFYLSGNALDLARDRLEKVLAEAAADDFSPEFRAQLDQQLTQLNQRLDQINEKLDELTVERQASPLERAAYAINQGAAGIAINLLADAEKSGISLGIVKPRLIDLYCNTGQPDKALDLLSVGVEDPNLGTEPGTSAFRQGQVYFLLGNYLSAATLWQDRAIPRLRFDRVQRLLSAAQGLTRGDGARSTSSLLSLPSTLNLQASWEYDTAICKLEAGMPEEAADHFTRALTLAPGMAVRPIAAYYLEKMGRPIPDAPKNSRATTADAKRIAAPNASPAPATAPAATAPAAAADKTPEKKP
jgi:hypothetical protein